MWKFACLLLVVSVVAAAEEQNAVDQDAYNAGVRLAKIHKTNPALFNTMIGRLTAAAGQESSGPVGKRMTTPIHDLMAQPWMKALMNMASKIAKTLSGDEKERQERFFNLPGMSSDDEEPTSVLSKLPGLSTIKDLFSSQTTTPKPAGPFDALKEMFNKLMSSLSIGKKREVRQALMAMMESASYEGKERERRFFSGLSSLSGLFNKPTTTTTTTTTTTAKPEPENPLDSLMANLPTMDSFMANLPKMDSLKAMFQQFFAGKKREVREANPWKNWKNSPWKNTSGRRKHIKDTNSNTRDKVCALRKKLSLTNDGECPEPSAENSMNNVREGMNRMRNKNKDMMNRLRGNLSG